MFKAILGDLFQSRAQTLVNTVNCVGVMGKGVAEQFKKPQFPDMFEDYKRRSDRKWFVLENPISMSTHRTCRSSTFQRRTIGDRLLGWRTLNADSTISPNTPADWKITSIALPPLGCGNGGLEWSEVGPLIFSKLHALPIRCRGLRPVRDPETQLTREFLSGSIPMSLEGKGQQLDPLKPEWVVLMEVLQESEGRPTRTPVGKDDLPKNQLHRDGNGRANGLSICQR